MLECRRNQWTNTENGFTLIELLIVVAIIAILAAIAVPNFLEAQVRAKVSRAVADIRTIATGLESYFSDNNKYPPNPDTSDGFNVTPWQLTTPLAYLTSRPIDPFKIGHDVTQHNNPSQIEERFFYDYFTILTSEQYIQLLYQGIDVFVIVADATGPYGAYLNRGAFTKYGAWLQWSIGPDIRFWIAEDDFRNPTNPTAGLKNPAHLPWGYSFDIPYDATNGSTSFGNIIRCQRRTDGIIPFVP